MNPSIAKEQLDNELQKRTSGTLLVEGPTLVGKTTLIERVRDSIEEGTNSICYAKIFTCSQSHAGYEPILDTVEELSNRENWAVKHRMVHFARKNGIHIFTVVAGVFRRFFPDAISKEALDKLRSSLDSVLNSNKETDTAPAFTRSDTSELLRILRDVVEKSGRKLILFVDRLEELPTPGIKLLQLLAESPQPNVVVVLAANSASTEYFQRKDIRELANVCKRSRGNAVWAIEGYTAAELNELKQINGYKTDLSSSTKAYDYSIGGRIGLLADWLNCDSDQGNMNILKPDANRLRAHYAIEYDRLEETYKHLIKCLGVVYPGGLDLHVVAVCLQCDVTALESKLHNVLGPFAVISNDAVSLKNNHVLYFLHSQLARALMQAEYDALVAKLPRLAEPVQTRLAHKLSPSVITMDVQTLISNAKVDLARGANQSAINRIDAWRKWQDNGTHNSPIEAELILVEGDALGQLGIYDEAIEKLNQAPPSLDVSISLGEKYFRAGNHSKALERLTYARRRARAETNLDAWLEATSRTLSVRNEMMLGKGSALLANCIAKCLEESGHTASARERSRAHRTLARTYSHIHARQTSALRHAKDALEIAVNETKSLRDEGNARYALADTYRHMDSAEEAIAEYRKAKDIAISCDNYDLKLYALLGIAACYIKECNVDALNETLNELENMPISEHSPEEQIVGIFRFAHKFLSNDNEYLVDAPNPLIGRPWTYDMLKLLSSPMENKRESFKQVLIVL